MKKFRVMLLAGVLAVGLAGCQGQAESQSHSASVAKRASVHRQVSQSMSRREAEKSASGFWSTSQDNGLDELMKDWAAKRGETYQGTYASHSIDFLTAQYPRDFREKRRAVVYDTATTMSWDQKAYNNARFRILAAAAGGKSEAKYPNLILFTIDTRDNSAVVLVGQPTDDTHINFYETTDHDLQQGFAKLAEQANSAVHLADDTGWEWTKDSILTYLSKLDARTASLQSTAVAATENGALLPSHWRFINHGRTGQLVATIDWDATWSLTKTGDGQTAVSLQNGGHMLTFQVDDQTHLIQSGTRDGTAITDQNSY